MTNEELRRLLFRDSEQQEDETYSSGSGGNRHGDDGLWTPRWALFIFNQPCSLEALGRNRQRLAASLGSVIAFSANATGSSLAATVSPTYGAKIAFIFHFMLTVIRHSHGANTDSHQQLNSPARAQTGRDQRRSAVILINLMLNGIWETNVILLLSFFGSQWRWNFRENFKQNKGGKKKAVSQLSVTLFKINKSKLVSQRGIEKSTLSEPSAYFPAPCWRGDVQERAELIQRLSGIINNKDK